MQDERNPLDVAWAAGLFEGEGCWNVYTRGTRARMQIRLGMADRDVVERFAAIMGCGTVFVHDPAAHRAKGWKPLYTWAVYEAEGAREVIALLLPFMGERRRARALEVLEGGKHVRPHNQKKTHCPNGHALEGDNLILEPYTRANKAGEVREFVARRCKVCRREKERERARKRLGITPDRYRITGDD